MKKLLCAAAGLVLLLGACTKDDPAIDYDDDDGPKVSVTSEGGATVKGNVVDLKFAVKGIDIVKADGDTSGKTGHIHVFVDKDAATIGDVIAKEPGIIHTDQLALQVSGLEIGSHTFLVVLGDGGHKALSDAARVTVQVEGPTVHATAPAAITAGAVFNIDLKVEGVTIVAADGDKSGKTGHLHVLIDPEKPPTADGVPLAKVEGKIIHTTATSIPIPALTAGEHVLFILVGDGTHIPLSPLVMHRLAVTVT